MELRKFRRRRKILRICYFKPSRNHVRNHVSGSEDVQNTQKKLLGIKNRWWSGYATPTHFLLQKDYVRDVQYPFSNGG